MVVMLWYCFFKMRVEGDHLLKPRVASALFQTSNILQDVEFHLKSIIATMTAQSEQESIEVLTSLMGDGDPEVARRVYRKFNGDMNRAATAILEGDTGESEPGTAQRPGTPMTGLAPHAPANVFEPPPRKSLPINAIYIGRLPWLQPSNRRQ